MGLHRVIPNLRVIALSEIEGYACANLVAKMEGGFLDPAPIWTNLKTFPCEQFRGLVDIFVAGYPCQPFSAAGQRKGADDPRHLWPFIQRAIGIIRPRWCFFENVEGHLTLGFKDVCHDLDELGYVVTAGIFSAAEVGASHQRKRLFILARNLENAGLAGDGWTANTYLDDRQWSSGDVAGAGPAILDNAASARCDAAGFGAIANEQSGECVPCSRCGKVADTGRMCDQLGRIAGELGSAEAEESSEAHERQRHGDSAGDRVPAVADPENGDGRLLLQPRRSRQASAESAGGGEAMADSARNGGNGSHRQGWRRRRVCEDGDELADTASRARLGQGNEATTRRSSEQPDGDGGRVADTSSTRSQGRLLGRSDDPRGREEQDGCVAASSIALPRFPPGPNERDAWRRVLEIDPSLEPAICRMADGTAYRVDRLRLCGNGVVPDTAAKAFVTLYGELAA